MAGRRHSVSEAIGALPVSLSAEELLQAATALLAARIAGQATDPLHLPLLYYYHEHGLVDPPHQEHGSLRYGHRQVLQVCAVQVLRAADFDLERIAALVQGVDDEHLRLLCDEPEEARKKAHVMRNWMSMLDKGRYFRPDRGETEMIVQGAPAQRAAAPRAARPATSAGPSGAAPDPRARAGAWADAPLPDALPSARRDLERGAGEGADGGDVLTAIGLPDAMPGLADLAAARRDRGPRGGRSDRETLAHGDLQRLVAAFGALDAAAGDATQAGVTPPPRAAAANAHLPPATPIEARAAPVLPAAARIPAAVPEARPPTSATGTITGQAVVASPHGAITGEHPSGAAVASASGAPPGPTTASTGTITGQRPAPSAVTGNRPALDESPRAWRRHLVGAGVELHVELGPQGAVRPRDARTVDAIVERVRKALLGGA